MFESVVYKNNVGYGTSLDAGLIAESLIFYRQVHVAGTIGTIRELLGRVPPFIVLSLMREGRLRVHYLPDQAAIYSNSSPNGRIRHGLGRLSLADSKSDKVIRDEFCKVAGNTGQARVGASQFRNLLRTLHQHDFDQGVVLRAILDDTSLQETVGNLVNDLVPGYRSRNAVEFSVMEEHDGLYIETNIDFDALNENYHRIVPKSHSTVNEAYILSLLQGAYETAYLASKLDSEVAVNRLERTIQVCAIRSILARSVRSESQIEAFSTLTLSNAHAIREAVNSGKVSFTDIRKLLEKADKFRHWLHERPVDSELVSEYYKAVTSSSWAETHPGKMIRWGLATLGGLWAGEAGGAAVGAGVAATLSSFDTFLLERFAKGWRPHQFVHGEIQPLIGKSA